MRVRALVRDAKAATAAFGPYVEVLQQPWKQKQELVPWIFLHGAITDFNTWVFGWGCIGYFGSQPVVGDVTDPTSLKKALLGVRAVICPTKVNNRGLNII